MLTKAQLRTLTRAHLTDSEKQVWSDSILDIVLQTVLDEAWSEILDEAPWYRSQLDTLANTAFTAPGYIDVSASGPLTKRFYRVQKFTRNTQEYGVTSPHDNVTYGTSAPDIISRRFTYNVVGSQLWAFPLDTNCGAELRYSFLPTTFTSQLDAAAIDWVDGFESVIVFESLLRMVDDAPRIEKYTALLAKAADRLKSRVRREYVGPGVMNGVDTILPDGGT